jgi:hypothetical protein
VGCDSRSSCGGVGVIVRCRWFLAEGMKAAASLGSNDPVAYAKRLESTALQDMHKMFQRMKVPCPRSDTEREVAMMFGRVL